MPFSVPTFEREDLRAAQVAKLKGILIGGELEPAFALVDKAAAMMRDGVVRYIAPSQCVSRDTELQATKRDKDMITIEGGELHVRKKDSAQSANVSTDFLLQQALTRRGLALDRVGVLDFSVHERIMRQFFHMCARPAPAGYEKPQTWHVVRADKEMWAAAARDCRKGCKPDAQGKRPLDDLLPTAANSHLVTLYLLPVAVRGRTETRTDNHERPWTPKGPKGRGKDRSRSDRGAPKGKGKGKGKGKKGSPTKTSGKPSMPKELRHLEPTDAHGRRKCYGWNLEEGCSLPTSGHPPECERGLHACMACGATDHGAVACPHNKPL